MPPYVKFTKFNKVDVFGCKNIKFGITFAFIILYEKMKLYSDVT